MTDRRPSVAAHCSIPTRPFHLPVPVSGLWSAASGLNAAIPHPALVLPALAVRSDCRRVVALLLSPTEPGHPPQAGRRRECRGPRGTRLVPYPLSPHHPALLAPTLQPPSHAAQRSGRAAPEMRRRNRPTVTTLIVRIAMTLVAGLHPLDCCWTGCLRKRRIVDVALMGIVVGRWVKYCLARTGTAVLAVPSRCHVKTMPLMRGWRHSGPCG